MRSSDMAGQTNYKRRCQKRTETSQPLLICTILGKKNEIELTTDELSYPDK